MPVDDDEQLTLAQIADLLGVNPSTVRVWVKSERLPAMMVGRRWVVRRGDLAQMLEDSPRVGRPIRDPQPTPTRFSELAVSSRIEPLVRRRER